jgi:hypothetical protein
MSTTHLGNGTPCARSHHVQMHVAFWLAARLYALVHTITEVLCLEYAPTCCDRAIHAHHTMAACTVAWRGAPGQQAGQHLGSLTRLGSAAALTCLH